MIDSLSSAAENMDGILHGEDRQFDGVSIDSRSISDGELFFALQGPNFDGHDFIGNAKAQGAAGAVVSNVVAEDIAQIAVDDVQQALGRLGATWRASKSVRVVGVTGSNGKTTLKEMIAACLATKAPTLATIGNLNNEIGLPLTLTRINDDHEYAVIEMGANHAGEIAYLTDLTNPDVVVITNAGAAHLEGFGSVEGVAHAKGEILRNAKRPSIAVLNADDDYFDYWVSLAGDSRIVSFGFGESADVRAVEIVTASDGSQFGLRLPGALIDVSLPLPGMHNVRNACAAAAVASALNIGSEHIKSALEAIAPVAGRLWPCAGINGCTLFDDTYNANPLSVVAAADFLGSLPGESWLVLGDMQELGEGAEELHREVGASIRTSGVDRLFAIGDLSRNSVDGFGDGARWYASLDTLIADVSKVSSSASVLVKGSRSMRMERVVAAMRAV